MASIDQILRQRRAAARRTPTAAQEVARFQRARASEAARRARSVPPPPPPGDGGGGGGTAPTPFSQTRAGVVFAAEQQRQSLLIQRQNAAALARRQQSDALIRQQKEQVFQRQQLQRRVAEERRIQAETRERKRQANIGQLRVERQGTFAQLLASGDQARAVMFALGFGPENDAFDVRARSLGTTIRELKGARQLEATTEAALSRVLGRDVDISREGVRGLGSAVGAARSFVQGGADVQQLLTSAFGVGSLREGERPGISAARLGELIEQVVPRGVL
ncbi:hypothetical protein LCGC14_2049300 [marine sediment metagenome]|uniref:Uncharacterized protein n=1 Tax=marine sediment metagenome TaxID=412755 RepID=A0A0F9EPF5_9ZZZZ